MAKRIVGLNDFDHMEIDETTGQLFWHGREVVVTRSLPRWAHVWAIILGVSGVAVAIHTVAPDLIALYRYLAQ